MIIEIDNKSVLLIKKLFMETLHKWDRGIKKEWSRVLERVRNVLRTSVLTAMTIAGIVAGWKTLKNHFVEFRHTDPDYTSLSSQFYNGQRGWADIVHINRWIDFDSGDKANGPSTMSGGIFDQREKLLSEKCDIHTWGWWNEDSSTLLLDPTSKTIYFGEKNWRIVDNVMCLRFKELALSVLK